MKTIVHYTLFFSRENNQLPFLVKSTLIYKNKKLVHASEATVSPKYKWELAHMFKDFRAFMHEEADKNEVRCSRVESCKFMSIEKTWEG